MPQKVTLEDVLIGTFMDRCDEKLKAFHTWLKAMGWWYYKDAAANTYVVYKIVKDCKQELFSIPLDV